MTARVLYLAAALLHGVREALAITADLLGHPAPLTAGDAP